MANNVNKPAHYQIGGVRTIDVIRARSWGRSFGYYCEGNAIKYLTAGGGKGGVGGFAQGSGLSWLADRRRIPASSAARRIHPSARYCRLDDNAG